MPVAGFSAFNSTDAAASASGWLKDSGPQTLALDHPNQTHAPGTLDASLPVATAANVGVSDSMVYALLALLAGAMAWACSGFVSRKQTAPVSVAWGETQRAPRQARVKMMPLNVNR